MANMWPISLNYVNPIFTFQYRGVQFYPQLQLKDGLALSLALALATVATESNGHSPRTLLCFMYFSLS